MNCPRCSAAVAFMKKRCDNCGQDLRSYRRTVSMSNSYYNMALSQAKVRDLSGAIHSLKQSLQFNKLNTSARNLLGLIYYEEGEIVAALSEWVLSKHFQEKDNDADDYIREVQSNPSQLDMYNQTIKKYNAALSSARHGDEDMAIIQLKKVVNLNPKFIRANQLLALLYMKTGRRDNRARAYRLMRSVIKVDVTNTTTLRYLKELSDMRSKSDPTVKAVKEEQDNARKASTLPDVEMDAYKTITPYKEERPSVLPLVNVMIGIIIGLAVMYFLIIPHMRANLASNANENFKQYSENQAASDSDVSTLKNQNQSLQKEVKELEDKIKDLQGGDPSQVSTIQDVYDTLLDAYSDYQNGEKLEAAEKLVKINVDRLTSDTSKKFFETIQKETYPDATQKYFENGRDAYNGEGEYSGHRDYDTAIELLNKSLSFDKDNTDAIYFLGRCYQQTSDAEKAKTYYNQIIEDYPDSARVAEANRRLRELGQ
ncbi:MAG: tetratricopeptide repeat protein [Lachnospiraceae bacterium]|nr:tetratricopeptide repeat protein [Lachnospiraceae bacterium]